jgi:hypothetical protein
MRNVLGKAGRSCADGYHILQLLFRENFRGESFIEERSAEEK